MTFDFVFSTDLWEIRYKYLMSYIAITSRCSCETCKTWKKKCNLSLSLKNHISFWVFIMRYIVCVFHIFVDTVKSLLGHGLVLGCSRKKKKTGRVEEILFENAPEIFRCYTLPLEIPDKTRLHLWKIHKIVLRPLETLRPKAKNPGKFSWFFLDHPWKFHVAFN